MSEQESNSRPGVERQGQIDSTPITGETSASTKNTQPGPSFETPSVGDDPEETLRGVESDWRTQVRDSMTELEQPSQDHPHDGEILIYVERKTR